MGLTIRGRRPLRAALFLSALAASAGLAVGCGPKPVAVVNGESLTEQEFSRLCETATRVMPQQGTVGMQVLAQWVGNTLLAQEAKRLNVYPSEQELNARVDTFRKQAAYAGLNFEEELRKQGRDLAAFRREQLANLISENVLFYGIDVSDEEVRAEFEKQKAQLVQPETVEISQITLDSEKAKNDAVADLAANARFENVATTRSRDQFAQNGGRVPIPLPRKVQPGLPVAQEVVDAAFKLKPGQISDPVKVGATWVIVRLERKSERKEPQLDAFRETIRAQLREQKARSSGKIAENQRRVMEASARAEIRINRPEYQALAAQFKPGPGIGQPLADAAVP